MTFPTGVFSGTEPLRRGDAALDDYPTFRNECTASFVSFCMTQRHWTIISISTLAVVVVILGLRVAFDDKFDDFDRYVKARDNAEDPEEFDRNFAAMAAWLEQYKRDNPGATDEDASAAYDAAWGN